jgi:hypothetical protein
MKIVHHLTTLMRWPPLYAAWARYFTRCVTGTMNTGRHCWQDKNSHQAVVRTRCGRTNVGVPFSVEQKSIWQERICFILKQMSKGRPWNEDDYRFCYSFKEGLPDFKAKIPIWVKFWGSCNVRCSYSWSILRLLGLLYVWWFGIFLHVVSIKFLHPCYKVAEFHNFGMA